MGDERKITGYDPITGEPIYSQETLQPPVQTSMSADTMPKSTKKIAGLPLWSFGLAAGILIFILWGVLSGLFMSKEKKVMLAAINTLKDGSALLEVFHPLLSIYDGNYSLTGEFTDKEVSIEGTIYISDFVNSSIYGVLNIPNMPEFDFAAEINSQEVKLQSKTLSDYVFVYKTEENKKNSFLEQNMGRENLELLDECLTSFLNTTTYDAYLKEYRELIQKVYKEFVFEPAAKRSFEVNNKKVLCKGYRLTITKDHLLDIIHGIESLLDKYYADSLNKLELTARNLTKVLEDSIDRVPDRDISFYLHKNQLAAIILETDQDMLEINFQGGDYRMQNILVSSNYGDLLEIRGTNNNSVEKLVCTVWGSEVFSYSYDIKSGDLVVELEDGSWEIEANVQKNKEEITFKLEEIHSLDSQYDLSDLYLNLTYKGSENKPELFSSKEFNVGTATEKEFMELWEQLQKKLESYKEL